MIREGRLLSLGHNGMLLQAEDAPQLQEDGPQHKHIDLQDVGKVQQHEGVAFLAADDVDGGCSDLQGNGLVKSLGISFENEPVLLCPQLYSVRS